MTEVEPHSKKSDHPVIGSMWNPTKAQAMSLTNDQKDTEIIENHDGKIVKRKRRRKYRSPVHRFVVWFVASELFSSLIMLVIVANSISIAVESNKSLSQQYVKIFSSLDLGFLCIYAVEAILKIYAAPRGYWKNAFNRFDFAILIFSLLQYLKDILSAFSFFRQVTFLRVLRALRALRALRGVSFIRGLQVILVALAKTMASIGNLISILFLMMYVFAIMGFYLFGEGAPKRWGSLGKAFYSLFIFVTVDGWTDAQNELDQVSMYSRIYTVSFIWIGNFIFTNLFIGVVIQNLEQATDEDKRIRMQRRRVVIAEKKAMILKLQEMEVARLLSGSNDDQTMTLQQRLAGLAGKLRHEDLVPMTSLVTNRMWLETFMVSLHHQTNTVYKQQQIAFEIANSLAEMMERKNNTGVTAAPINNRHRK